LRAEIRFNPARALTEGKPIGGVSSTKKTGSAQKETPGAFFNNPASMKKKIIDAYYPSSKVKETPLVLYKFNRSTKSIKKINIVDNNI
jgi:hypothetical protein